MKTKTRIGETRTMNCGMNATITKYVNAYTIEVTFKDGYVSNCTRYDSFKNGTIRNPNIKHTTFINRTGEENINNQGLKMWIREYRGALDIDVEFENGYISKNKKYDCFKYGAIKNFLNEEVCGVAYFGDGKYNGKSECYSTWATMINRCNNHKDKRNNWWYKDCTVCKEWYNYQNFAQWYQENYYNCKEETMCLDKDILVKHNKIYDPNKCVFAPNRINVLFTKSNKARGQYPIGVYKKEDYNKFIAQCSIYENGKKKHKYIGSYTNVEEAFNAYRQFKESYIKQVADEYKSKYPNFPQKLYDAMYSYEVEITD